MIVASSHTSLENSQQPQTGPPPVTTLAQPQPRCTVLPQIPRVPQKWPLGLQSSWPHRGQATQLQMGPSLILLTVKLLEGLEFINEGLVLIFKDSHAVFQTLDVLFLLTPALLGCIPVFEKPEFPLARGLLSKGLLALEAGCRSHHHTLRQPLRRSPTTSCADLVCLEVCRRHRHCGIQHGWPQVTFSIPGKYETRKTDKTGDQAEK